MLWRDAISVQNEIKLSSGTDCRGHRTIAQIPADADGRQFFIPHIVIASCTHEERGEPIASRISRAWSVEKEAESKQTSHHRGVTLRAFIVALFVTGRFASAFASLPGFIFAGRVALLASRGDSG